MQVHQESTSPAATSTGSARKPRKSRGRGLRTTTGCTICRKRHTKCDEAKPICGPCAKGNRPCTYGPVPDTSKLSGNESESGEPDRAASLQPVELLDEYSWPKTQQDDTQITSQPWITTPEEMQVVSPQSQYSTSNGYDNETAPLRWFGLLAGDAAHGGNAASPNDVLGITALSPRQPQNYGDSTSPSASTPSYAETVALQNASILVEPPVNTPMSNNSTGLEDERSHWQSSESIQLQRHEHVIFQHYVTGVSLWIDLLDPFRHFSTYVPHLALKNEGLMKAVLALGSRYLSIKSRDDSEIHFCLTAAKKYYQEALQYLQSAMRYASYKNSPELLTTVLIISTYEMIDGPSREWERHLKGVYWIQRSRNIHRETSRLELSIWWAWLRQDVWAAFRERRRCFSSFNPPRPCVITYNWDMATQIWWILGQAVNYSSDVEKEQGQDKVADRILTGNNLLSALERWRESTSVHFQPLPCEDGSHQAFKPLWFQPSAIGTSLQVYCMARILLLVHQPAAGGFLEIMGRDRKIMECVETIGGIALKLDDEASCMVSIQCLFAAGRYCTDVTKREDIARLVRKHSVFVGWPSSVDLVDELRAGWANTPR